jgi:ParB-like chromosome segregation protein Spo0J
MVAKKKPKPNNSMETWPIEDLTASPHNARLHKDEQITRLMGSIERFGFTIPVLVGEDGRIIAGHGRVEAARRMGLPDVPVIVAKGWTEEQCRAYGIADNRLAEMSEWDLSALRIELAELGDLGIEDLSIIGFDDATLAALAEGTFAPTLLPGMTVADVTAEGVRAAGERLQAQHTNAGDQNLLDVMCPHCGKEFQIDRL